MAEPDIQYIANLFLYDLTNRAKEHWFKADEKWELVIATANEKAATEKKYFPVVSLKGPMSTIKSVAARVSARLDPFKEMDGPAIKGDEPVWLLAFSPLRLRT